MLRPLSWLLLLVFNSIVLTGYCASVTVKIYKTAAGNQRGASIGFITFVDTPQGLLIKPSLSGLRPGQHGFHIHQYPLCANYGQAAGGHYDPKYTDRHRGPYKKDGHRGDLPYLAVAKNGETMMPLLAPHLTVAKIRGHSVVIHKGGDNYSDKPLPLGGGGARIACGVIAAD